VRFDGIRLSYLGSIHMHSTKHNHIYVRIHLLSTIYRGIIRNS